MKKLAGGRGDAQPPVRESEPAAGEDEEDEEEEEEEEEEEVRKQEEVGEAGADKARARERS